MDKSVDVRRGASRFLSAKRQIKQSGHKLVTSLNGGEDVVFWEKSKKERERGLNLVGRASSSSEDSEMGGGSKRFKLHGKPFDDCKSVDPAAVPRKLRSAMNKRNHESISPPLPYAKKLQHTSNGIKSPRVTGVKKSKQNMKQRSSNPSQGQAVSGPITKDEEEVVETLYALARMFPNNSEPAESVVNQKISEAKSSPLIETRENLMSDSEAPDEKNVKPLCPSTAVEATDLSPSVEGSPEETVKVIPFTELAILERPNTLDGQKIDLESDSYVPRADVRRISLLSKSELIAETGLGSAVTAVSFNGLSELLPETGSMHPKRHETPVPGIKPENMLWPAAAIASQQEEQHPTKENKESRRGLPWTEGGPALWPGLSATGPCGGGVHGPSAHSSAIKAPAWLDSPTSVTKPGCAGNDVSMKKIIVDRRQLRKRCATHVSVSHFIRAYELAERKDRFSFLPNLLKPNEGIKAGVMAANDLTGMRNCLNGVIFTSSINGSAFVNNPNEVISVPLENRLHQDEQQVSLRSGIYTVQKQSCDFLSLSAGGGGVEANNNINTEGNGLDPSAQLHVPYQHSLVQHHQLMPFSLPNTRYPSSPYPDQLTTAQQLQLPQYLGSPFYGPHLGHTSSGKQQQHMWAAQYRSGGIPVSHFPMWQNGRHDSLSQIPCAQAVLSSSPSLLEVPGPKYSPGLQQQQLFAITPSLSLSRVKRQHHHLLGGYDEDGGGFHSETSSHSQLLCNAEQL
ncbi:hypothetical protein HHK36_031213 [Tetracentron sinense]|uniref:Uncharacterized protein n=1 Tax=Tetracentron sinense TaxID=13715 RepID=A0A834Y916_TETSI|nr:hypothetical protein HHK36_031213 [Tetracentron sinense]